MLADRTALVPRLPAVRLPRPAWAAVGGAAFAGAVALLGWVAIPAWLLPDLGLLAGGLSVLSGDGRLAPRAVRGYNALHALPGPAVLLAVGAAAGSPLALGAGVLWLSHIAIDRALGYGLRAADGSQRA